MHRYQAAPLRSPPPSSRTLPPRSAPPSQTSGSSGRSAPSYDRYPVSTTLQSGSKGSSLGKSDGLYAKDDVPAGQEYNDVYDDDDDYGYTRYKEPGTRLFSSRGMVNVVTLMILIGGLLALFAGYPIIEHFRRRQTSTFGAFNIGGTNGTGQVPLINPQLSLVDSQTPTGARTWSSPVNREQFHLVFSDEFEVEGRTFWPGDDPFWEAVNLWYGATGDYEWYHPGQINTTGGALQLTMENKPMNNLNFRSGMLQSWNKFCFQGGYIEFSVKLPGTPSEVGWWPGLWLQGNLGRPGYLGTTDGMWPYSYNSCDSGILPNQTAVGRPGYQQVSTYDQGDGKIGLSWNPGMRTPSCTCSGEDHPGPDVNVGRGAPELDILEAQINTAQQRGEASQSLQTAPFDMGHKWDQGPAQIYDAGVTTFNGFDGNTYQETVSGVTDIPNKAYLNAGNQFTTFGVEFAPDFSLSGKGSVTWYIDGKATWTITEASLSAQPGIDIGQRLVPVEPMSIILNLGISRGFQANLDFNTLNFPAVMLVDYVRVYQPDSYKDNLLSCDPQDYPTKAYIQRHLDVYDNANVTRWKQRFPKNRLTTGC